MLNPKYILWKGHYSRSGGALTRTILMGNILLFSMDNLDGLATGLKKYVLGEPIVMAG